MNLVGCFSYRSGGLEPYLMVFNLKFTAPELPVKVSCLDDVFMTESIIACEDVSRESASDCQVD